jgi:hypothetical protein
LVVTSVGYSIVLLYRILVWFVKAVITINCAEIL